MTTTMQPAGTLPQPVRLPADVRDKLIQDWQNAKDSLDHYKNLEMELRQQLNTDSGMFDPAKEKGTMNFDLGNGYKLQCVRSLNITVENKEGEAFGVMAQLDNHENQIVRHLAKDVFKWSPELRVSKLDELTKVDPAAAKLVRDLLTEKPGSPQLKLIEPK